MTTTTSPVVATADAGAAAAAPAPHTIDVDTGGTFTDGSVARPHGAIQVKADATPDDLRAGILRRGWLPPAARRRQRRACRR